MRKKIAALLLVVVATMSLTACGKFTCDICGEEKTGKSYKTEVWGQDVVICKDCYEDIQAVTSLFK